MRIIRVRQPILNSQFSTLNSKFPMDTGYLIILAVIAVVCLFFARRKKNSSSGTFKELTKSPVQPVILIHDIDKETLKEAYDRFSDISEQEVTSIEPEDNGFRLTFTPETDYIAFCYWVNYLVYSDEEKQKRYSVYGWYPFGEVEIKGEKQPFSNQTVMMYVDKDDTEHDNISFVTPDGNHYLQPFAIFNNLKKITSDGSPSGGSESYCPCPNPKTQEKQ